MTCRFFGPNPPPIFDPGRRMLCGNIRLFFAYTDSTFYGLCSGVHPFVVACKGCHKNISAHVGTIPDTLNARFARRSAGIFP